MSFHVTHSYNNIPNRNVVRYSGNVENASVGAIQQGIELSVTRDLDLIDTSIIYANDSESFYMALIGVRFARFSP